MPNKKRLLCVVPHSPAFDSCFPLMERLHQRGRVEPFILLGPRLRQVEPRARQAIEAAGMPFRPVSLLGQEVGSLLDIARADAVLTHSDPRAYGGKYRLRDRLMRGQDRQVIFVQHGMVQAGLHYAGPKPTWTFHAQKMLVWTPLPDPQAAFFGAPVADRLAVTGLIKTNRLAEWPDMAALRAEFSGFRKRLLICHNFGFESHLHGAASQTAAFAAWDEAARAMPDTLLILRGHRGRRHPATQAAMEALVSRHRNVMLSERHAGLMRMSTINDVMAVCDAVISHPSTVILDAVYDVKPIALHGTPTAETACLPRADTAAEIVAFVQGADLTAAAPIRAVYGDIAHNLDIAAETVETHMDTLP